MLFLGNKSITYYSLLNYGCDIVEPYQYRSRMAYKIRYLFKILRIDNFYPSYKLNEAIKEKNPKMIVIIGSLIYSPYIKSLRRLFPTVKIKYFYTNVVAEIASISPSVLKRYNIIAYSWDFLDCEKYSLRYMRPFFDYKLLPTCKNFEYDVCFIGSDKGRYKMIRYLQDVVSRMNKSCYFLITADYSFLRFIHAYYSRPISYDAYLKIVASSRCIIDLVQKGQTGTTTRVMEALFSGKKLITNNKYLRNYDFYNSKNIFILGEDDVDGLGAFIEEDFEPVKMSILQEYTTSSWLYYFLEDND